MRFVAAADGHCFGAASAKAAVEVASTQGCMPNLDAMTWNRRMTRKAQGRGADKNGSGANGLPFVWLRGQLRQILTKNDVEAVRQILDVESKTPHYTLAGVDAIDGRVGTVVRGGSLPLS